MRELRLVLLGLAAVIALLLGGAFLTRALRTPGSQSAASASVTPTTVGAPGPVGDAAADGATPDKPDATLSPEVLAASRSALERAIADAPDYARFFDRLRLAFPSDYETIMTALAARNAGRDGGKDINVDAAMAEAVAAQRKAHGALAARSTDEALGQVYAYQLKTMQVLAQSDPHLCVALLYGANLTGFAAFSADHRALVADSAIASLDAMASGRNDHIERGAPSDADFKALDSALVAKGLTRPQIDTLLDGTVANPPIPDDVMCAAGQHYLEVLAALPPDLRARLYEFSVDLMAKS